MGGWPAETGEASALFQLWVASLDSPSGQHGGFSNADFDKVYKRAIVTVDAKRESAAADPPRSRWTTCR